MNRLKPNHRGVDLRIPKDQKGFIDKKTNASGVFREIILLLPGLSEVIAARLVDLMGEDGLKCLKSNTPSYEISILLYSRYLEFLESNGFTFSPPMDVRRECLRRKAPQGLSQDDIDRASGLLLIIFKNLSKEKIAELANIVTKPALKIIWANNPLFLLKQYCMEHQKKWLIENGVDVAQIGEFLRKKVQIEKPKNELDKQNKKPKKKSMSKKRSPQFGSN